MRVIAGKARRTLLKTPEGFDTRPTTDRTKETLFNIINGYLPDCDFLDLFSGSGAIGIEAISRGAKLAVFSEVNRIAIEQEILGYLNQSSIVYRDTIIIVEASLDTTFDYLKESRFQIYREKNYKTNKHVFIELKE